MAAKRKGWGIEVLGMEEAVQAFKDAETAFGATPLKECLIGLARKIRDAAKMKVRRKSGLLSSAIFAAEGKDDLPSVIVGVDRKKAPHAHLIEFGHAGPHPAPPYPYMRPAFDEFRIAAKSIVGQEINNRIIKKLTSKRRGLPGRIPPPK